MMDNSTNGSSSSSPPPINDNEPPHSYIKMVLEFISQMLMEEEEDLGNNPYMLHDVLALQATEQSLHDALHNVNLDTTPLHHSPSSSSRVNKKINFRSRDDSDMSEHHTRSHKQSANNNNNADDESEPLEKYDDVLLCPNLQTYGQTKANKKSSHQYKQSKRGPKPNDGRGNEKDGIDLRNLLMQCADAVAKVDNKAIFDLMWEIRQHSSPKGNDMERLAHYFANALDARFACTGNNFYAPLDSKKRISAAELLKVYKTFVVTCPFRHMSNVWANATIYYVAISATTLHIIDFGILYGFQWPCLIQVLSKRSGGPPKIRITGIDFPQPGFRPAERVADTGRRLAKWAARFGVPFEYNAIAQKWDTIRIDDLKIEKNDLVVVNSMFRLHNVSDEMESDKIPRDDVLNLIRKINPEIFIHGVVNGMHNTPFFVPRFREALFYFSSMFDMFEATMPQDDENRLLFEEHFLGMEAINIIACEGTERVERPERYNQWQRRTVRAGFTQVPIYPDIVKTLRKIKMNYHTSFTVEEDGKWVLTGWKGRVLIGFSCWRPIHN